MQKEHVNAALKLLTDNMTGGILALNDEALDMLRQKHPEARNRQEDITLQGPMKSINPILFVEIDDEMIIKAAKNTKGGSGPSGMDADGWRKILVSRIYGDYGKDLRRAFAEFIKKIFIYR